VKDNLRTDHTEQQIVLFAGYHAIGIFHIIMYRPPCTKIL